MKKVCSMVGINLWKIQSRYEIGKAILKIYLKLEDSKAVDEKTYLPLTTSFVEQRKDIDQFLTLYSFEGPFELLHANMVDLRF